MQREIKERPIIFSAEMVRAILESRKTQTRREIKFEEGELLNKDEIIFLDCKDEKFYFAEKGYEEEFEEKCPYGKIGDRLAAAKEIPNIPKIYCATTDGRIFSKVRGEWNQLKEWRQGKYPVVTICNKGKKTSKFVHHLICAAFYGEKPSKGSQVRHLNGDRYDNRAENLCWGTQEENWLDRKAQGNGIEGEKHHSSKFTNEERNHIRWAIEKGLSSQRNVSRILGVSQSTISSLVSGNEEMPEQEMPKNLIPIITLEITDIRVERLNDICHSDAMCEGIEWESKSLKDTPKKEFQELWESIKGKGSWEANPFVWVIEFKVIEPELLQK